VTAILTAWILIHFKETQGLFVVHQS